MEENKCPDCGVDVGQRHYDGCDVTRCKVTGTQMLSCGFEIEFTPEGALDLVPTNDHECEPCIWTGEWPGVKACRENGWYTTIVGIDGPTEDLNSLIHRAVWNSESEDWEPRK